MDNSGSRDTLAFRNLQQTNRFKVLASRMLILRPMVVNEGAINLFAHGQVLKQFSFAFAPRTPIKVTCQGTSSVVTDVVDNSLHVVAVSTDTAATIEYQVRLRFKG